MSDISMEGKLAADTGLETAAPADEDIDLEERLAATFPGEPMDEGEEELYIGEVVPPPSTAEARPEPPLIAVANGAGAAAVSGEAQLDDAFQPQAAAEFSAPAGPGRAIAEGDEPQASERDAEVTAQDGSQDSTKDHSEASDPGDAAPEPPATLAGSGAGQGPPDVPLSLGSSEGPEDGDGDIADVPEPQAATTPTDQASDGSEPPEAEAVPNLLISERAAALAASDASGDDAAPEAPSEFELPPGVEWEEIPFETMPYWLEGGMVIVDIPTFDGFNAVERQVSRKIYPAENLEMQARLVASGHISDLARPPKFNGRFMGGSAVIAPFQKADLEHFPSVHPVIRRSIETMDDDELNALRVVYTATLEGRSLPRTDVRLQTVYWQVKSNSRNRFYGKVRRAVEPSESFTEAAVTVKENTEDARGRAYAQALWALQPRRLIYNAFGQGKKR